MMLALDCLNDVSHGFPFLCASDFRVTSVDVVLNSFDRNGASMDVKESLVN